MNPSCNLFLVGPMGAGKTSMGRHLALRFDLEFVDLDSEIEADTGADINLIFEHEGEAGFRAREHEMLQQCSAKRGVLLACGGGIVLDAGNRELLRERGFVVYLDIGVEQQLARLRHDRSRPLLAAADRRQRLMAMAAERNPLYAATCDLRIEAGDTNVREACMNAAECIGRSWQRAPHAEIPA
ncbi:MAG: shikimate kinase [Rhodanobacteraceae bacterium]